MLATLLRGVRHVGRRLAHSLSHRRLAATTPTSTRLVVATLWDLPCTKGALITENALLRQQLAVLQRSVKRAHCTLCAGRVAHPWLRSTSEGTRWTRLP